MKTRLQEDRHWFFNYDLFLCNIFNADEISVSLEPATSEQG